MSLNMNTGLPFFFKMDIDGVRGFALGVGDRSSVDIAEARFRLAFVSIAVGEVSSRIQQPSL